MCLWSKWKKGTEMIKLKHTETFCQTMLTHQPLSCPLIQLNPMISVNHSPPFSNPSHSDIWTTLPPNPVLREWSWTCGRPSIFPMATSAAWPRYWRRWDAMTALFPQQLNTEICLPGSARQPGEGRRRKKIKIKIKKRRVGVREFTPESRGVIWRHSDRRTYTLADNCVCVHSSKEDRNSSVYSAMTQLNIGNKGCKNLEGKEDSLPVISPWLLSFALSLSLSLSLSLWYNNLIFLALVSLETAVQLFGWTVRIWGWCPRHRKKKKKKLEEWETIRGQTIKGAKASRSERASLTLQNQSPWTSTCSVIT